ncbi:MAG: 2'-5' RNA ligase family protein [Planctomycetota bacterium]|jgi:2'-5' RNA ligase
MAEIAVDIVLLPSEEMADKAIAANKELLKQCAHKIVLDKESCLPHISLAMGCIDDIDIDEIDTILRTIAEETSLGRLNAVGIETETNQAGEKVSVFKIEKTEALQLLHEEVMRRLSPYFSYDVKIDMILSSEAGESTLNWIKNYPEKSSFEKFYPHITIGYGEIEDFSFPMKFKVSKLALCHLGNHCTCKVILASVDLK